jgi:NTE family protein
MSPTPVIAPRRAGPARVRQRSEGRAFNIVHLIYRAKSYESHAKDYEFSRAAMRVHWQAGYDDAVRTLRRPEILEPAPPPCRLRTFDIATETD